MDDKIYIWLLYAGGPAPQTGLRDYLHQQLQASQTLAHIPKLLRPIFRWFMLRHRHKKLVPLLTGPCSSYQSASKQAAELERLLGPDYQCIPVHRYGSTSIDTALRSTPPRAKVIITPMMPLRSSTLFSLLEHVRRALHKQKCNYTEIGNYALHTQYGDMLATSVRNAIIQLQGERNYGILFLLDKQPESWRKAPPDLLAEATQCARGIMQQLNNRTVWASCYAEQSQIKKTLTGWKNQQIDTLITIDLSHTCTSSFGTVHTQDLPQQIAINLGYKKVLCPDPPGTRPAFLHLLVERILQAEEEWIPKLQQHPDPE